MDTTKENKVIVLFSGGWESTYCLVEAMMIYPIKDICAVYLDYGQPYIGEKIAARETCDYLSIEFKVMQTKNLYVDNNPVFNGRNTLFFTEVFKAFNSIKCIYFGSRGLLQCIDKYGDSNWSYGKTISKALHVPVYMPCTLLPKMLIKSRLSIQGITDNMIFSTDDL